MLAAVLVAGAPAHAQQQTAAGATLNGYVTDTETQETLIGATVAIKGTKLGAYTNKSGYFSIPNIPPGRHTVSISSVGYERKEEEIEVGPSESKKLTFALTPKAVAKQQITVTADKEVEKRQIDVSRVNIPVEQLRQIRIGGESDIFRSLQYMPGILTSSQISSGLYIRGGSPDQNLVLIDGSTVYNPSHLLGFFSAFNPDAIKDVDLIKGGFPSEFGGRMSAVLNLTQKDGNRNEFEGVGSIGAVSSRLSLQGPLGKGSYFVGGRRTYLDLLMGLFPEDKANPFPTFNFYDLNAKVTQDVSDNDRISLSGFTSEDKLGLSGAGFDFNIGMGNRTGALRWTHIFGDNLFTVLNLSASRYHNGFSGEQSGFKTKMENVINDYTAKATVEWFASNDLTVKAGYEGTKYRFDYLQNFTGKDSVGQSGQLGGAATNLTVDDWMHAGYGQIN